MILTTDEWRCTSTGQFIRYWRKNAVVYCDTSINDTCRWEVHNPPTSGTADDAWRAMYDADRVDGFKWVCPSCHSDDTDGEMHMYCRDADGNYRPLEYDRSEPRHRSSFGDAVSAIEAEFERMQETLRGFLVFEPPAHMTREQIIAAYREHARQGLEGFDDSWPEEE